MPLHSRLCLKQTNKKPIVGGFLGLLHSSLMLVQYSHLQLRSLQGLTHPFSATCSQPQGLICTQRPVDNNCPGKKKQKTKTKNKKNLEASDRGNVLQSHRELPLFLTTKPSLDSLLSRPGLRLAHSWISPQSCFPTGASETPVWGPHLISLTRTGIGPQTQKHTLSLVSALVWYFYF